MPNGRHETSQTGGPSNAARWAREGPTGAFEMGCVLGRFAGLGWAKQRLNQGLGQAEHGLCHGPPRAWAVLGPRVKKLKPSPNPLHVPGQPITVAKRAGRIRHYNIILSNNSHIKSADITMISIAIKSSQNFLTLP